MVKKTSSLCEKSNIITTYRIDQKQFRFSFCFFVLQKPHGSLMENKLLSAEERKDIFYDYDVFVTHRADVHDKEAVDNINVALQSRNMNILMEKNCIGKDWLTKLKYAATKCRWIVFLDTKTSDSKMFTSSKLVESLKRILESRKVQTVAIVGERDGLFIHDDLRCVTCIPYHDDDKSLNDTLYKTLSGEFAVLSVCNLRV